MIKSKKKWIILFGGAGREACIERMLLEDINVPAIVVPARRNAKLEAAVSKLKALNCELIEVERSSMAKVLGRFEGSALLSIGFPYLVPAELLGLFKPALNLHPTLLPRYRGPTSGAYILMNDEKESGSTIHYMTAEMDRGEILMQNCVLLSPFDTIRSLQRKVYAKEPELVIKALLALENGRKGASQDESQASEFPKKRTPKDSELDPALPLIDLVNKIRACDPSEFPAFFMYHGQKVCVQLRRYEREGVDDDEM